MPAHLGSPWCIGWQKRVIPWNFEFESGSGIMRARPLHARAPLHCTGKLPIACCIVNWSLQLLLLCTWATITMTEATGTPPRMKLRYNGGHEGGNDSEDDIIANGSSRQQGQARAGLANANKANRQRLDLSEERQKGPAAPQGGNERIYEVRRTVTEGYSQHATDSWITWLVGGNPCQSLCA